MVTMKTETKFYKVLDKEMKKQNFSNEKVAKYIGVSRSSIQKYRSGASSPNPDKIIKIAELLEISIDYLLTGKGKEERTIEKKKFPIKGFINGKIVGTIEIDE